ncbi:MAG: NADH-quinone oxidoreductase subunit F, partial [Candidatus Hydrogenedentes bacterium]|nr:NADH-quinone oxidoreductase subunit F [Candidatus Hydrogenedentota bacterium]
MDSEEVARCIARLRREDVERPVVFVGAGTCGLGAGAGKTLNALRAFLARRRIEADVVEVGCIGLCSAEPLVDVLLPGRNRISFEHVTAEVVDEVMDAVLAGRIPADRVLGQHRGTGTQPWERVPYIDQHPFFAPQTRWVLSNCGIIDPTNIDEYIACGGYKAFAETLR